MWKHLIDHFVYIYYYFAIYFYYKLKTFHNVFSEYQIIKNIYLKRNYWLVIELINWKTKTPGHQIKIIWGSQHWVVVLAFPNISIIYLSLHINYF